MSIVSAPPMDSPVQDTNGNISAAWTTWIQQAYFVLKSVESAGPTEKRPLKNLWVGMYHFDTTLGIPIYLKTLNPIVWVNASGGQV